MANRAQYQRHWVAASRILRNNDIANSVENDNNDMFELPIDVDGALPMSRDTENITEQSQPRPKRACLEDICFDAPNNDIDLALGNDFGCSSDSEDDLLLLKDDCLEEGLAEWASKFLIKQNAVDSLLMLLKQNGHPNLPASARTLLKTTRDIAIQTKSGMEYVYFPVASELLKQFKKYPPAIVDKTDSLEISLNVDGLPLFKSSNKSLWPVLCAIVNVQPVTVFPVVLTYGACKPGNLEFLEDLTRDLGNVLQHGLQDGDKTLPVSLRCVVCDAPARALVKATKLCSGYFG